MKARSPRQLKDWIKNLSKENEILAITLLQNFMMERFLERISVSEYKENFILKGGFLIVSMIGVNMRSTMDIDTTIKDIIVNRVTIEEIIMKIISIEIDDYILFQLK